MPERPFAEYRTASEVTENWYRSLPDRKKRELEAQGFPDATSIQRLKPAERIKFISEQTPRFWESLSSGTQEALQKIIETALPSDPAAERLEEAFKELYPDEPRTFEQEMKRPVSFQDVQEVGKQAGFGDILSGGMLGARLGTAAAPKLAAIPAIGPYLAAAAPFAGAALGGGVPLAQRLRSWFGSQRDQQQRVPEMGEMTPGFQDFLLQQMTAGFDPIISESQRRLREETIPEIAERFAGRGAVPRAAFGQQLGRAVGDAEQRLAATLAPLQTQRLQALGGLLTDQQKLALTRRGLLGEEAERFHRMGIGGRQMDLAERQAELARRSAEIGLDPRRIKYQDLLGVYGRSTPSTGWLLPFTQAMLSGTIGGITGGAPGFFSGVGSQLQKDLTGLGRR